MSAPQNFHAVPKPSKAFASRNRLENGNIDEKQLGAQWRPRAGALLERVLSTISRVSLRLIDRTDGSAYSADELQAKIMAAVGEGTNPAWADITGKPTTIAGYGITDSPPLAIARTAEQGDPNQTNVLQITAGTTFPSIGNFLLHPVPGFSNYWTSDGTDTINPAIDWYEISAAESPDTFKLLLVVGGNVTVNRWDGTGASPQVATWVDGSGSYTGAPGVAASSPVATSRIGQLCIVDSADVYISTQVSPPVWLKIN